MMHRAVLAALLCLAACGQEPPDAPAPPLAEPTLEGAAVTDPRTVPPAFVGAWAVAECGEDTLEITTNTLRFDDSGASVAAVEATGADEIRIAVTLPNGRQRTFRYRLIEGGSALFDVRSGLTRRRCPA